MSGEGKTALYAMKIKLSQKLQFQYCTVGMFPFFLYNYLFHCPGSVHFSNTLFFYKYSSYVSTDEHTGFQIPEKKKKTHIIQVAKNCGAMS